MGYSQNHLTGWMAGSVHESHLESSVWITFPSALHGRPDARSTLAASRDVCPTVVLGVIPPDFLHLQQNYLLGSLRESFTAPLPPPVDGWATPGW